MGFILVSQTILKVRALVYKEADVLDVVQSATIVRCQL